MAAWKPGEGGFATGARIDASEGKSRRGPGTQVEKASVRRQSGLACSSSHGGWTHGTASLVAADRHSGRWKKDYCDGIVKRYACGFMWRGLDI